MGLFTNLIPKETGDGVTFVEEALRISMSTNSH